MTTVDTSAERNGRAGITLAVCCGVHAWQDGLTSTVNVMLPLLAQAFGLTYVQVGIVKAANLAAMAVLEIPSGLMSERLGQRALLVFGLIVVGCGYLWLSVASGFAAVLFSLFLAGLGGAFQHSLSSSIISAAYPGGSSRPALGTYNAAGDVGKLALTGLFTLILGLGLGWHAIALGYGAVSIVLALAVLALLSRSRVGAGTAQREAVAPVHNGWGIRSRGAFGALLAINFLDTMVQSGFKTFVAFLMIVHGVSVGLAALAVVLTMAGGAAGKFACGFLTTRMGIIPSLVLVEILTAAGIAGVVVAPPMVGFAMLPVLGVFLQGSTSITYGSITELVARDRQARGFSLIYTTSTAASVTASVALGLVSDAFGIDRMMLVMAMLTVLPLGFCGLLASGLSKAA